MLPLEKSESYVIFKRVFSLAFCPNHRVRFQPLFIESSCLSAIANSVFRIEPMASLSICVSLE